MKKWYRVVASLLSVLMLVSVFTFEWNGLFEASALRTEVVRDYTVGKTIDYDSVFSSAYIIVPNLNTSAAVSFTYRGRAVSEVYNAKRHFATVADAVAYHKTVGTENPVFYLCAATYSSSRLYFPEGAIVLGANAGITPNGYLNFDLPDVTKGWDAASRNAETVITIGIGGSGNVVIDGITYKGTSNFYIASDNDTKKNSDITVTLQNSLLSGFVSASKYFDTAAATKDEFGFDIKECRIFDSAATAPFLSNTRFIHTDGVYFTNITGNYINSSTPFTPYEFSLDLYRTYAYKCKANGYGIYAKYSEGKHKTSLVFDKFLWYEGNTGSFGFLTFFTTPDGPGVSHNIDVINSTFVADRSYVDIARNTILNGNQSSYQLGTYTINFNNNRVIGWGSMFPNVGGQAGTQKIHADFNNNYFADMFTSFSDTSSKRSEYYNWTQAHGTNEFNNIDYARIDNLVYYTDYALTTSSKSFYAAGVNFFENVDYVSIDNANSKIYVGMREGTVSNPDIIFEEEGVSAELYKTYSSSAGYGSKITSFSAPARGSSAVYYFKATQGSVTKCIQLHVYGEDAVPNFKTGYSDPTGTLSNSAYLYYTGSATSGNIEIEVDGKPYIFTIGQNAFKSLSDIFTAAGSKVPEIFIPYGEYGTLNITKPCKIIGQNRRGNVYTALDGACMRGSDWANGKTASLSSVTVSCDGVSFSGVTFKGRLYYSSKTPVAIKNCEFAGNSYIQLVSGIESINLSGLGITSTASTFIRGALPASVTMNSCYVKNGTAVTSLTWGVDQASLACEFNVDFCRFDNVNKTVISDVRRGVVADNANIVMSVTNNIFNVTDASIYAVNLKPANYNSLAFSENTFVSTKNSGYPFYLDTSATLAGLAFERNRFVGFAGIAISDTSVNFDASYNYFAPYSLDYEVESRGTAIPGDVYCSYYYSDYTMTTLVPSVTGYEFSDNIIVSEDKLTMVSDADITDFTKEITAECGYMLLDEQMNEVNAAALATEYAANVFTLRLYNQHAPCNRIDYMLTVQRDGAEELSFVTDYGSTELNEKGVYVLTLPEQVSGTGFSVAGHPDAQLLEDGNPVDSITDIREGESKNYVVVVSGIKYRMTVVIPISSGVYIDYDGVLESAYIIGADKVGSKVSFYFRGKTVTQNFDSARHFNSFEEAYASFLAAGHDIILETPVFIFAPGNYSAIDLKYRAIILGANAGISPISSVVVGSTPHTVPKLSEKRSAEYATTFYGGFTRAADDGTIAAAEKASDNRLVYYTVIDGVDISCTGDFFTENNYRSHYLSIQNVTSVSPLASGGGTGETTIKNAYVNGARTVSEIATDKLVIDGSYITDTLSVFDAEKDVTVKKNFIVSCAGDISYNGSGNFVLENNVISDVGAITVSGNVISGNVISGGMPFSVSDTTVVDENRFIGYETVNAKTLGKNYVALNFKDENDLLGLAVGDDYYCDYKMTLSRSDFNLTGVTFDNGVHSAFIDNDGAVVKLVLTDKNEHEVTFVPATNGVAVTVNSDKILAGNNYMLTLSKGGYQRQFTVITVFEKVSFFTESRGYGDIENTAVMVAPDSTLFKGEGGMVEWKGRTYKYVYGQNLFTSVDEARAALDGHLQIMLPARYFEDEFKIPADCSIYGVNFDINPNVQSSTLGDDWAKNSEWGKYGETEIQNVTVSKEARDTLVEIHGITLRGRIWDGERPQSRDCTEFNMINTVIEHKDWVNSIYGGSSSSYTITLTNANSTSGKYNTDRGMIKNMRVVAIRANVDVAGAKNRFLNERLPQTFTIDGLYMDMNAAQCTLFGWMKMSDYQKDGVFTIKNSNLRNAMNLTTTANFSLEGRDHFAVGTNDSVIANVENCTFYNFQAGNRNILGIATQAYSEINIKNNLFLSTSTPSKQAFSFTTASTLTNTDFNLERNRFVGTRQNINFISNTSLGTLDISDNYYAPYSADYKNVVTTKSLTGTNTVCNSYYVDYDLNFKNGDIAPYSFGNGIEADYVNKTLSVTLSSAHGNQFNINDYVVSNGGHTITCDLSEIKEGANNGTVTVAGTHVYTLSVYLTGVKEELLALCTDASAIMQSEDFEIYTEASRGTLRRELTRAQSAISTNAISQKLNEHKAALTKAIDGLTVDKSELLALIASVPDNADGRYSNASYASLTDIVNAAKALGDDVTSSVLYQHMADLENAISGLVDVRDYNNALERAKAVADDGIYSSQAVSQFKKRIQNIADTVELNTDIDVHRAVMLINNAYAYLTKDCVALDSAIARAEALGKTDCTVISYNRVMAALEKAYKINADSYQPEIDNAARELKLALDNVVSAREFESALAKALALTNDGQYTDEAWTAYTAGLDSVQESAQSYTSRIDVLKGVRAIALLSAGLVTDPSDLGAAIERYEALSEADYTRASFSAVKAEYENALEAANSADADAIADAAAALDDAIDSLVKKADADAVIGALKAQIFDDSICKNTVDAYNIFVNALDGDSVLKKDVLDVWQSAANAIVKPHVFGEYIYNNDATPSKDGTKTAVCERCGDTDTVVAEGTKLTDIKDSSKVFTDVKDKWYKAAVDYTYSYGLISGMSDTEFGINTEITRGMFITILARIAGVDTSKDANKNAAQVFDDVKAGRYYSAAVEWAYKNKVVSGVDDKNFAPDAAIERQQLCVMIVNFAKLEGIELTEDKAEVVFTDADAIAKYAKDAVKLCQRAGVISGYTSVDGVEFRAKNTATRAEAAQILYKFHKDFVNK